MTEQVLSYLWKVGILMYINDRNVKSIRWAIRKEAVVARACRSETSTVLYMSRRLQADWNTNEHGNSEEWQSGQQMEQMWQPRRMSIVALESCQGRLVG